jgi:hypothetical protein
MGRRGSDVAKEAAVAVGTDDNFASIVDAIRQGRAAYANIGKFVTHIVASNVSALVPFLAFVFRILLPLTVAQIRAVDLVPALALAEKPVLNGRHMLPTVHAAAAMRFPCSAAAFCATVTRVGPSSAPVSERRGWRGAVPWGREGPCVQDLAARRQLSITPPPSLTRSDTRRSGPGPG